MFGDRAFGWRGGMAALGGMMLAPLGVVLVLTVVYAHYAQHPVVAGALRGMGAVAAGLIFSTGAEAAAGAAPQRAGLRGRRSRFAALMFAGIALAARAAVLDAGRARRRSPARCAWRRLAP